MLRYILLTLSLAMALDIASAQSARPRLSVNIIVSGLGEAELARYEENFGEDGFRRLMRQGARFTECYADYAPANHTAGIATFATGTMPSTHGIFSSMRYNRTSNEFNRFCHKGNALESGILRRDIDAGYTTQQLNVPTFSEAILSASSQSHAISIAHKPISAILLAGKMGECYWLGDNGLWKSGDCYTEQLPLWVRMCNDEDMNRVFATDTWYGRYTRNRYRNSRTSTIVLYDKDRRTNSSRARSDNWVANLRRMPSGNLAILEFSKRALSSLLPLHSKDGYKVLNICLDVPRYIGERYGTDSVEYEDMLYSLDAALADFLDHLYKQLISENDVIVTLTSDSGMSPTQLENSDAVRFNTRQFEVILNAFLSARYGQQNWVTGYRNGSIYLNRDAVYAQKINLEEMQNELAAFALQFRGVANAATATTLNNHQFTRGVMAVLQNGFNARTSGDVIVALDALRIESRRSRVALSGSAYHYDRHIPLIICGGGIAPQRVDKRVTNDQIAPTIAKLMGTPRPTCSEAAVIEF